MKKGENGYMEDAEHDIKTDVFLLYNSLFEKNEPEDNKIEKLPEIFDLKKSEISKYLSNQKENNAEIKNQTEYLRNLSLNKLESLYKTIISMNKGKEHFKEIENIRKEIEIKKGINTLKNIATLSENFITISNLENWNNFKLNFKTEWEKRKDNHEIIKSKIANFKEVKGLYAIYDKDVCLYIGIGRPIWKRIKSHYHSSQRPENKKSKEWSDFFSQYQKELKIYWNEINVSADKKINDNFSEILETLMKSIYKPKFNR